MIIITSKIIAVPTYHHFLFRMLFSFSSACQSYHNKIESLQKKFTEPYTNEAIAVQFETLTATVMRMHHLHGPFSKRQCSYRVTNFPEAPRFSNLNSPLQAFGANADNWTLRETEVVTSLVYEVRGTLCYESESVVLLGSAVVKMNANVWFYFSCTNYEFQLRLVTMADIF